MTHIAPPHSYIDVKDFTGIKELAAYLVRVGSDPALYSSYFWWRDYYSFLNCPPNTDCNMEKYREGMCGLCQALHDTQKKPEYIEDLKSLWAGRGTCRTVRGIDGIFGNKS